MAINRYFNPTRTAQPELSSAPLQMLEGALKYAQEQYDSNYTLATQIKNKYINALNPDRATANSIQAEWEGRIDNIVSKYSGDYSQATKDLNLLLSDMQREYNPGGKAHAIEYNYKTWNDHWAAIQEGVQKKTYTAQQALGARLNFEKSYQGIGEKDPLTGAYAQAKPIVLQPYVDEQEIVQKVIDKVPKRTGKTVVPVPDGQGRIIMQEQEYEYVDPQEMRNAISQTLLNNDAWMGYNAQLAELYGEDPSNFLTQEIAALEEQVLPLYSGMMKQTQSRKIEYDQIAMENLRHGHAMARQRQSDAAATQRVLLRHALESGAMDQGPEELINIGNRSSATSFQQIDPKEGVSVGSSFVLPFGLNGGRKRAANIDEVLSNPAPYQDKYNIELLRASKEAAEKWRDKNGQPARDKQSLAYSIYNANVNEAAGSQVFMRRLADPKLMKLEAQRVLPQLQAGTTTLYDFDTRTGKLTPVTAADKRSEIFTNLYDTEKNAPKQLALGRTSIQSGVPFGLTFAKPDGNGYYIVAEPHEDVRRMTQPGGVIDQAFGFINGPRRTQGGGTFSFNDNNKSLRAFGKVDYLPSPDNPAVIIPQVRYYDPELYATDKEAALYSVPITDSTGKVVGSRPMTPADMEQKIFPLEAQKMFEVRGAAKSNLTHFPDYIEED